MTSLVADDARLEEQADGVRLSCRLSGPDSPSAAALPPRLWIDVPSAVAGHLPVSGNPFLPVLMVTAMKRGIPHLVIEAPVSPLLLSRVRRIMEIYSGWGEKFAEPMRPVTIEAPAVPSVRTGTTSGAFFSGGVDSFYTLLRNRDRYPSGDDRYASHLLLLHGFDVALDSPLFAQVLGSAEKVAREVEATLSVVRTNAREVVRGVNWHHFAHGPILAAAGLALSGILHTVFVPSGRSAAEPPRQAASHPAIDPLWSTEAVEFVHDGVETARSDKVERLVRSPLALQYLRVCWTNPGGAYNCGRCEKCLRTMIELHLWGVLGRTRQFPGRIDPAALLGMGKAPPERWQLLLGRIRSPGQDPARWVGIPEAIEEVLGRWAWQGSRSGRVDAVLSRVGSRLGLSAPRLKALDSNVLGGLGLRTFRRLRRRLPGKFRRW